jgi:hypothetical protein
MILVFSSSIRDSILYGQSVTFSEWLWQAASAKGDEAKADLSRRSDCEGGFVGGQSGQRWHYPGMAQKSPDEARRPPGTAPFVNWSSP